MGTLRKALRELEIAENTMLWFCSDNGAASPGSTGGLPGGKKWLTEGGNRESQKSQTARCRSAVC